MKSPHDIAQFLTANVPLFADFAADRVAELVKASEVRSFEANEPLAHLGDDATHLGVVLEGVVSASIVGDRGIRQPLGRLEAGGTFGELGLMTADKVMADFVADTRCTVLLLPVSVFQSAIITHPGAVQQLSRTIADRLLKVRSDPSLAAAALQRSEDPYGLTLRGERRERVLVVNCGSSSLKYVFYDTGDEAREARGLVERIGIDGTRHVFRGPKGEVKHDLPRAGFPQAFEAMAAALSARSIAQPAMRPGRIASTTP